MSENIHFTSGGATLVAETAGSGSRTYVFIHGIGMGKSIFANLGEHLRQGDREARTIAIDLPGYGAAPEPARVLTMERTADLIAAFIGQSIHGRAIVVGHSMGTQVAVEVAARHPDRVERLVLIAPTVDPRERTVWGQVLRLAQDLIVESPRVIAIGAREYLRAGPHLRGKFRAMLVHAPEKTYPRVSAPTLVIRGEHDYVSRRSWCRRVVALLQNATLVEVDGHGHETMIRDAAPSAAAIRAFAETE